MNFNILSLSKRERKSNYSVDNYFKDTLRAGPSKFEKAPKLPRAPKQIAMFVFPLCCSFVYSPTLVHQTRFPVFPARASSTTRTRIGGIQGLFLFVSLTVSISISFVEVERNTGCCQRTSRTRRHARSFGRGALSCSGFH